MRDAFAESRWGAMIALIAATSMLASILSPSAGAFEPTERQLFAAAIDYCRGKSGQIVLNEDKSVFCFDGQVWPDRDVSSLNDLKDNGLFVVRSIGGSGTDALKIAMLVGEKQATVVIYDYCMSACAQFFFVASRRTFIAKESIVAWHHGLDSWPVCDSLELHSEKKIKQLVRVTCGLPASHEAAIKQLLAEARSFYKDRVLRSQDFGMMSPPQSIHMTKRLRSMFEGTGRYPNVVWMWNPRYHKVTLKADIVYESYPESQERVDELIERFSWPSRWAFGVLHDP